jgi:SAM-dependent MidA family methyltransferase
MSPALVRLTALSMLALAPLAGADRVAANAWEVRNEIALPAGVNPSVVKEFFPAFHDYFDIVLFHPSAGYYANGRVDFTDHYRTFPNTLSPVFGQMLAEQMFRMWDGMRTAGTLTPTEKFTIAEFGPGNGALAESILDYIDDQAATSKDARWKNFQSQAIYASYDRSPALSVIQQKRNSHFGARFEARVGDATNPQATIPPGSLKGVVLSNELPDAFSVHKVVLSREGVAELAFAAPSLSDSAWATMGPSLPESLRAQIKSDHDAIMKRMLNPGDRAPGVSIKDRVYLSRTTLNALLDALSKRSSYEYDVNLLQFQEIYVPLSVVPEVAAYMRKYAANYANRLARTGTGLITYVNLGEAAFIRGAGAALKAGYVITIDYGDNWDGILDLSFDHLRMYGPGAATTRANPYQFPTLNDMTTDVNFSHLATEGADVGLKPIYFGPQHSLQLRTSVKLDEVPPSRSVTASDAAEFREWASLFFSWEVYKVLIQQKNGTDNAYTYPTDYAQPLPVSEEGLTPQQRTRIAEITKQLQR